MKKLSTHLCWSRYRNGLTWILLSLLAFSFHAKAQQSAATCNTFTAITNPAFGSLSVTSSQQTVVGIPPRQEDEFADKQNLIDNDLTNASTYSFLALGSAYIEVKDNSATNANVYAAGSFAGFVVNNNALLTTLGTVTITTYLGGVEQESGSAGSLLSTGLLSGRSQVGFITTKNFDRIRLTYSALLTGSISIYYAVVQRFCAGPALACNTPTTLNSPAYPVIISPANTGFSGVSVGTIANAENAISVSTTDFATLNLTANVGTASFAIKDQVTDYPAGTFAGFDISSPNLVNIAALSSLTVSTYLNGQPTNQRVTGADLVSVGSAILSGTGRQTIGFRATQPFDEVKLTISGATVVGTTAIYGAVFESFCAGTPLVCNVLTPVATPAQPVYIDGRNTGIDAAVCVACSINNSQNAIDNDASNFASIELTAGVVTSAIFAVANAVDTYAANSFAGFDIESNSLLTAGALSSATISLYNNGALVQTGTGNALIVGATTGLLTGRSRQIVGIVANAAYDEAKITFNQVANSDLGTIRIYSAVFENTCPTTLICNTAYTLSSPAFPAVINGARTGTVGAVGVAATVQDAWNIVSASTTDFATITNTASVGTSTSIAVLDPINTFPTGTFAGFTVRRVNGLVTADLFDRLTITTYLDGTEQESRSGRGNLLDLSVVLFGSVSDFANVGFATTKAFDEVRISVAPLVGVGALNGKLDVFGAFIDTRTSTGGGLACALTTNPDFTVTNRNVPVSGSVRTNDNVPTGTTYGPAPTPASQPAGSSPTLTVNPDGTFTFTSTASGVYVYNVPVCAAGSTSNCQTQALTVTVLDPTVTTNNPVANPDFATTTGAATNPTPVTIDVTANDAAGNPGGTLGTPTIPAQPANGTASIDGNGNLVYTPTAGFAGTDVVTYQVCETPGNRCATTTVTITVNAAGSPTVVSINDDYSATPNGTASTGNLLDNDLGTGLTVSNSGTTQSTSGTLVVTSTGSYTFTPAPGTTGPVTFTYTACNNASNCGTATLHILVGQGAPDLTPIINLPSNNFTASGDEATKNFTVGIFEVAGQQTSSGNIVFTITAPFGYSIAFNNSLTNTNVSGGSNVSVDNTKWTVTSNNGLQLTLMINAGQFIPANGNSTLGFTISRTVTNSNSTANITVNVADDASKTYDSKPANNIYARNINAL